MQGELALSGALETTLEGGAVFDLEWCAFVPLQSDAGHPQLSDDRVTSEARRGPTEGALAISRVYKGGYYASFEVEPDGPWYRSVGGEVVIEGRTRGRVSVEAKPLDREIDPTDPSVWLDEDGPSLFIEGTFDARGLDRVLYY